MMDFLLGFTACYAVTTAIEARAVLRFSRAEEPDATPLTILFPSLIWPWTMWQMGEDD